MKILAIDPGPVQSAYVFWDTETHDFCLRDKFAKGILPNYNLRTIVISEMAASGMDLLAIEMPQSYGKVVGRSMFETCLEVGRFIQVAGVNTLHWGGQIKLYGRPTIKGQIGGRTDAEIRASLRLRYGDAKKGQKLEGVVRDIWSALALATALDERINLKEW